MVAKSYVINGGTFRSQLRADSEFSLNLWKNKNILHLDAKVYIFVTIDFNNNINVVIVTLNNNCVN
jgi:hypothetical protein